MENASWQLAHDYCAEKIASHLRKYSDYHVTEVLVPQMLDCDCIPVLVTVDGKDWHLNRVVPENRLAAWYRT